MCVCECDGEWVEGDCVDVDAGVGVLDATRVRGGDVDVCVGNVCGRVVGGECGDECVERNCGIVVGCVGGDVDEGGGVRARRVFFVGRVRRRVGDGGVG